MYSRESEGPRTDLKGTPALTRYSCEDFPSRTTWSCLILRKEEIRPNIWPEIPEGLSLWRRPACQTLLKPLDKSSATAWAAWKTKQFYQTQLSEDLQLSRRPKTILGIRKRPHFSIWPTILLLTNFSKILITEIRLTGR